MKQNVARHSKTAGYKKSLLPEFSKEDSKLLKGSLDFLGVNLYTANVAKALGNDTKTDSVSWLDSMEVNTYQPASWKSSASSWLKVHEISSILN